MPFVWLSGRDTTEIMVLQYEEIPEVPLLTTQSVSNVEGLSDHCKLIREGCLLNNELTDIKCTLKAYFGDCYVRTLLLHKHSRAVRFNGELYGSLNSLHSSSALVCAKPNTGVITPGFVRKYVGVNIIVQASNETQKQQVVYLASINWLSEHEHKHWFGTPVEVWRKFLPCVGPNTFVLVTNIFCRCAHLTEKTVFNQMLEEVVTIVVPLNHFSRL